MNQHEHARASTSERHGEHAWDDAGHVRSYVDNAVGRDSERLPQMELLGRLLPFEAEDTFRFLDLGAGHGGLSRLVLERYPNSSAVLLDASGPMLEAAAEDLSEFTNRATFVQGDFAADLPPGPFGAVISSLAVHHVASARDEGRLYQRALESLTAGGCLLNLDMVASSTPALEPVYNHADHSWLRPFFATPRTDMRTVEAHLTTLRDAGFSDVDCFWKSLHEALYGGFKRDPQI